MKVNSLQQLHHPLETEDGIRSPSPAVGNHTSLGLNPASSHVTTMIAVDPDYHENQQTT